MDDRKLIDEIKKLVSQKDMIPGFFNGTTFTSDTSTKYTNLVLTSYNPGKAFIVKYQDSWLCVVSASNELIRTNIIVDRRNRYVEPIVEVGNIKILFSQIEDNNRVFYVLDENSKENILIIDAISDIYYIQGNLFNYGVKNEYTNSIQYLSNKLNVVNIVGDTDYPLWDVTQITTDSNPATYLGSSVIIKNLFPDSSVINNQQSEDHTNDYPIPYGTVKTVLSSYDLVLSSPSIYFDLMGTNREVSHSIFIASAYFGDIPAGYFSTDITKHLTYESAGKNFVLQKTSSSNNLSSSTIDRSYSYNAELINAESPLPYVVSNTTQSSSKTITGTVYLGNYTDDTLNTSYNEQNNTVSFAHFVGATTEKPFGGYTEDTFTDTRTIKTSFLTIEGVGSSISCYIDYSITKKHNQLIQITTANLQDIIPDEVVDKCIYYFNNGSSQVTLNREKTIIICNTINKIIDETTTTIKATAAPGTDLTIDTNLESYIGHPVSYAQYIDENNSWLGVGTITNAVPVHIDTYYKRYEITVTFTSLKKVNFVSYATKDGVIISNNGSIFTLLNILFGRTTIVDRYIMGEAFDYILHTGFAELLKFGSLIGNKFYICQNNEVVKTKKTDLYVEQWDIGNNGDITRNDELIKLPVNSLDSSDSIIHSIQYWNTK